MSKTDDLNFTDDSTQEPMIEQGPTPAIAPRVGSSKKVVDDHTHCGFCGGRLHFVHATDFSRNTTHEKASCPECGLEARQVLHRLQ